MTTATGSELTPRECEVLRLVAEGLTQVTIAIRLFISRGTVRNHMTNIFTKLEVDNAVSAVVEGIRRGIITI